MIIVRLHYIEYAVKMNSLFEPAKLVHSFNTFDIVDRFQLM